MRIIRGKYGRRRFDVPNNITARPTTDFARENIFNVLENLVDFEDDEPTALDLFSGTGAITFEFLSRGCKSVTSVEKAATQYNFITKVAKQLGADNLRQVKGDALKFIPAATQSYDIVFADPPYDLPGFADIPQAVLDSRLLHAGSIFIIEHSRNYDFSSLPGFKEHRAYGSVNFSIFIKEPDIKQYPMKSISLNTQHAVTADQVNALAPEAAAALAHVMNADAPGNDFLGWVNLPSQLSEALLDDIAATAADLNAKCDTVVAIGIGGSYLGAKAVIDALGNSVLPFIETKSKTPVLFAGQNIGEDYLHDLMEYLKDRTYGIIVISKSGTTTEPAIAFRLLKDMLEKKLGKKEAAARIVAITDAHRGALRQLATEEGYKTYVIDDNVGGRFSVLTPVGLLPIAVAGYDIHAIVGGARMMETATAEAGEENVAMQYAIARNILYRQGKKIEILVNYNPKLHFVGEWWKQLYGESEGKDHKGIFPAAVDNSTDLHSMGQWIQDGERTIFETVISVEEPNSKVVIPTDEANLDGLNYIAGKRVDEVNKMAELGTRIAHVDGGVPNLRITIPAVNEESLGQLLYFFEKACGISGYMLEVNPFNQPGVEAYKKNMFALLEKPGYEAETEAIKARL